MKRKIFSISIIVLIILTSMFVMSCGKSKKSGFELVQGSGATMTAALKSAYQSKEWVVVTGWTPHWKFNKFKLKYLKDPKKIYGGTEFIHTIVRKGLKEDMPQVYEFLDKFKWTAADMQEVMLMNLKKGTDQYENAKKWVMQNEEKVKEWLPANIKPGNGKKVKLIYVEWSSEIASTNVVKAVLQEKMGYKVKMISAAVAMMYQGMANGDADAMVSAWLPSTHKHYLNGVKDKVVDLGPNLSGTKLGLVVPQYVTIDSISELAKHAAKFNNKIIGIDPGAGEMKMTRKVIEVYNLK